MKLIPGPWLIPSLAVGAGVVVAQEVVQQRTDWGAIITAVGGLVTAGSVAFVLIWKAIKKVQAEVAANTVISTQTRDMADGRLTAVTKELAESKEEMARLVSESVTTAAQDLLAEAQAVGASMTKKAEVTATELLAEARKEAAALLAAAEERAPRRRR